MTVRESKDGTDMNAFCHGGLSRRQLMTLLGRLTLAAGTYSAGVTSLLGCSSASKGEDPILKIGYLPITDASPLLIGHSQGLFEAEGLSVAKPVLMRGWAEISEAFLAGTFNLVHLLIPLPIYMRFAEKHPVKVVAWNHMNGSALTVGGNSGISRLQDLGGKQIAVPHWYSMHNVILQLCLRQHGIEAVVQDRSRPLASNQTNLFVMKPPDMPTALAGGAIHGYIVAEPFNAAGEMMAGGKILRFTGDVFKNHPCCVAVMRERDIDEHPDWAQKVVNGLVRAQKWLQDNREESARILSKDGKGYLPLQTSVIERAMLKYDLETYGTGGGTGAIQHPDWGIKRIDFQPYPYESATQEIVRLLAQTRVEGNAAFLNTLNPDSVVSELFEYELVKRASDKVGGLQVFEGVSAAHPYSREEMIAV